jgi:IS5 family transposase
MVVCGFQSFQADAPFYVFERVHFRNRIVEEDIELILKESIRINSQDKDKDDIRLNTKLFRKKILLFP